MDTKKSKLKLALMVNMIAPYRIPLFSVLANEFDMLLLHGGREKNRDSWIGVEAALPKAKVVRAWGWKVPYAKKVWESVFDDRQVQIMPGYFWHLLRFRPDILISNEMGLRSATALVYGAIFRKPVWIWWGGTIHSERTIGAFKKGLRKLFALSVKRWVSYGQTSTEYLLSLGVPRDRILQSQNAIDEELFKADAEPMWKIEPRPVVLHVGQYIERKGIGSLLEAAAVLQRQGFEFSLLLVGSGKERDALERRALSLGLKHVRFEAAQAPEKMPSVYRSADLVVFPTLEDVWGLVANEAILSGVPVLCSKYAGCAPELFTPEHIFSPEDITEFSQKLADALSGRMPKVDPTRLKTTSQLGSELIQELARSTPEARVDSQVQSA